jgi:hypothetical protein
VTVEIFENSDLLQSIIVASSSAILAVIAAYSMIESKKLRVATERMIAKAAEPIFAIEPDRYNENNNFEELFLVNYGPPASNIKVHCNWGQDLNVNETSKTFYIISLARDTYAKLELPIAEISRAGMKLNISADCLDSSGKKYSTVLAVDFGSPLKIKDSFAFQTSYWAVISGSLESIKQAVAAKQDKAMPDNQVEPETKKGKGISAKRK